MKRKRAPDDGSRFLQCPACQKSIPEPLLNIHLDTDCSASMAPPPPQTTTAQPVGWWDQAQQQPHPLAFATSGRQRQPLTDEQLRAGAPCEVVRHALPKELAAELLAALLAEAPSYTRGQWIMFGKTHDAPRTSCFYSLEQGLGKYGDVSAAVDSRAATGALLRAADIVNARVQQLQKRVEGQLAQRDVETGWRASYALANFYRDGSEAVAAHSDRITPLGKRPTIASLSLGATRTFRLRRASDDAPPEALSSVDVALEHNTLLIMWPPTQEEWRHEVPRSARVAPHALSGLARMNLTFRRLDPASAARAPLCRCGNPAVLKASPKRRHAYYFACDNTKGSCGFWQWDD